MTFSPLLFFFYFWQGSILILFLFLLENKQFFIYLLLLVFHVFASLHCHHLSLFQSIICSSPFCLSLFYLLFAGWGPPTAKSSCLFPNYFLRTSSVASFGRGHRCPGNLCLFWPLSLGLGKRVLQIYTLPDTSCWIALAMEHIRSIQNQGSGLILFGEK